MIHAIITIKPSDRYPGKNAMLREYTACWLAAETMDSTEQVHVWLAGDTEGWPVSAVPTKWHNLHVQNDNHHALLQEVEDALQSIGMLAANDVLVLCQLTQPLRRRGLLADVVRGARALGAAATYTVAPLDTWRLVHAGGWEPHAGCDARWHDGALYAWTPGHLADAVRPDTHCSRRMMICNYHGPVVDIDRREDVPPALAAQWAELMLAPAPKS